MPPWPLLALSLLAGPATAATVLSVGDGDTLRVADGPQLTKEMRQSGAFPVRTWPTPAELVEGVEGLGPSLRVLPR